MYSDLGHIRVPISEEIVFRLIDFNSVGLEFFFLEVGAMADVGETDGV
jgi:hypothetical protein